MFSRWFEAPEGKDFREYLSDYRSEILHGLTRKTDTVELYRLQGGLAIIEDILQLRGEVSKYLKGIREGTMKKIEVKDGVR